MQDITRINTSAQHTPLMLNNSEWEHKAKRLHTEVANRSGQEGGESEEKEKPVGLSQVAIARTRAGFHGGGGGGGG